MPLLVISGCSGAGKSTLIAELARRGHLVFDEPGRQVVKEERASGGDALPWTNGAKFAERCIALALEHIAAARGHAGTAFCDRSLIDAVSHLEHVALPVPKAALRALAARPYHRRVFMTPPWPEIFATDAERRQGFADAAAEYDRLLATYRARSYETVAIPKRPPAARADFVVAQMAG